MSTDTDHVAACKALMQQKISHVRGRAQTSGGAVDVETDANSTITDLRISQAAMSVEPARLASAIAQCHRTARERAEAEAARIYTELLDAPESPTRSATPGTRTEPDWEEPAPLRITHSL